MTIPGTVTIPVDHNPSNSTWAADLEDAIFAQVEDLAVMPPGEQFTYTERFAPAEPRMNPGPSTRRHWSDG